MSGTTIAPNTFNAITGVLDSGVAANATGASQPHPLSVSHPPPSSYEQRPQNYPSGTSTQDSDTRPTNPVANTTSTTANGLFLLSLAHWELTRREEAQRASRSDCDDDVPPLNLVIDATHDPDGVKELGFMNEQPPLAMDELGETVHEVSALPSPSQEHVFTPRPVPSRIVKPPDKLHPTLSCWLKNMSKLSSLIDRLQELTSSAPPEHRAQLSNQVETLRATFKKQQERCIGFLQLSEEYASKYLNHISSEIQQQSSFLEMLEKRLDMAKMLHRQAVDLRRSYESGTVANIKDVRATGKATSCHLQGKMLKCWFLALSQPLPVDFDLFSEMDLVLTEIRRCFIELNRFWTKEICSAVKALEMRRVDPKDIERWRSFHASLKQTIESWEVWFLVPPLHIPTD